MKVLRDVELYICCVFNMCFTVYILSKPKHLHWSECFVVLQSTAVL